MLFAIVALLVIIADQWVKYWVSVSVSMTSAGEPLIPGIISLVNVHNDGCAWSLLSGGGARIYFIVLTGVFTVAVILALATRFISGKTARWSLVLVTAGGLSNCIDRVINGYVQDMFKLELFNFPIFNVADIFITVCCIIFVFAVIFGKEPEKYHDEFEEEDDEEADRPKRKGKKLKKAAAEEVPPVKPAKNRKNPSDDYEQYKAARAARPQNPPVKNRSNVYDSNDPFAEWEKANAKVEAQHKNSYAAQAAGVAPGYSSPKPRYNAPSAPAAAPRAPQAGRKPAPPRAAAPARPVDEQFAERRPAAPVQRPAAPVQRPAAPVQRPAAPAQRPAAPAQRPAAPAQRPAAPAQRPAVPPVQPKPQAPSSGSADDFDLDSILNEFK